MDVFEVYDAVRQAKEYVKENNYCPDCCRDLQIFGSLKSDANKLRTRKR